MTIARGLLLVMVCGLTFVASIANADPLPGTDALTIAQPLDEYMVDGIDRFALRALAESVESRAARWKRDYSDPVAYEKSVAENRQRFRTIIGAVDPRTPSASFELLKTLDHDGIAGTAEGSYQAWFVRWQILEGVTGEGILLQPLGEIQARVVAIPDADWSPEQFVGLVPGKTAESALSHMLASQGIQVLIPTLINREQTYSGSDYVAYTNQPHREFIYRQAFEMGRHVIGYEVEKVQAAVDVFLHQDAIARKKLPVGVAGIGEGGLIALYSGAVDTRIDAVMVSGYFQNREGVWEEPIYRNVWSLLTEFGDADLASLVAPRTLVIEACAVPEVVGPPQPLEGRRGGAAPGKIQTATLASVRDEYDRSRVHFEQLDVADRLTFVSSREGDGPSATVPAVTAFLAGMGILENREPMAPLKPAELSESPLHDAAARQKRQFDELGCFTQTLLRRSAKVRDQFWANGDRKNVDTWIKTAQPYRDYVWEEMIGKLPAPTMPPNVRTRQVLDEPGYRGYEVVIDVYSDVVAAGILLLPKDLKEGERRPVVVCQHGLEGVPMDTITREGNGFRYYSAFAHELANRGFITYAPQNPYRGQDRFRTLQRKSNPLKRSLFSYIIRQHERTLDWLATLPNVDADRIAFYGLSYGGKTAVRVPPILTKYCLSICSADYNEWVVKNVTTEDRYSYMFTGEYEMFEWNMGHVANYSELATLMTPRPFMVERGHLDGVAPDEWVAWEYAKVRRHYAFVGIPEKTEIEYFNGPHSIHGVGTYDFLHRHLKWPAKKAK